MHDADRDTGLMIGESAASGGGGEEWEWRERPGFPLPVTLSHCSVCPLTTKLRPDTFLFCSITSFGYNMESSATPSHSVTRMDQDLVILLRTISQR